MTPLTPRFSGFWAGSNYVSHYILCCLQIPHTICYNVVKVVLHVRVFTESIWVYSALRCLSALIYESMETLSFLAASVAGKVPLSGLRI